MLSYKITERVEGSGALLVQRGVEAQRLACSHAICAPVPINITQCHPSVRPVANVERLHHIVCTFFRKVGRSNVVGVICGDVFDAESTTPIECAFPLCGLDPVIGVGVGSAAVMVRRSISWKPPAKGISSRGVGCVGSARSLTNQSSDTPLASRT